MLVYRLCKKKYENDMSGTGSVQYPGRWNREGFKMLYTSENSSLSILEVAVHYRTISKIEEYTLIIIDIPKKHFSIIKLDINQLPDRWDEYPLNSDTQAVGTEWIQNSESLLLSVPSAINLHEHNILINPLHPDLQKITIVKKQPYNLQKKLIYRLS